MRNGKGRLNGKTAIITGGTSGIGRALVERFTVEGAHVCFTGRRAALGRKLAAQTGALFIAADVRDVGAMPAIVDEALTHGGGIDILINNAGDPGPTGAIEDISIEDFDATMSVHLRGTFAMMQAVIPAMKAQGSGVILNMGSITGHRVGGHSQVYGVAKAGLSHLTRFAAAELGPYGIRVNALSPGFIPTEIHGRAMGLPEEDAERISDAIAPMFVSMQSIVHAGTPADVADAAIFLVSDEAQFVTGIDLLVDGGLALGKPRGVIPSRKNTNGTDRKKPLQDMPGLET